jgi:hypothetical protein
MSIPDESARREQMVAAGLTPKGFRFTRRGVFAVYEKGPARADASIRRHQQTERKALFNLSRRML